MHNKAFGIAKNPNYDGYQRGVVGGAVKNENRSDQPLVEELPNPIIRKFKKRRLYSSFIANIWFADLADMQCISKSNNGFIFLLCITDVFGK